jgi:hypothetical protein
MATELDLELELEAQESDLCEQVEAYFKSLESFESEDVNEKVISNF